MYYMNRRKTINILYLEVINSRVITKECDEKE